MVSSLFSFSNSFSKAFPSAFLATHFSLCLDSRGHCHNELLWPTVRCHQGKKRTRGHIGLSHVNEHLQNILHTFFFHNSLQAANAAVFLLFMLLGGGQGVSSMWSKSHLTNLGLTQEGLTKSLTVNTS